MFGRRRIRQLEAQLAEATERLDAQRQFVSNVSHELRTPLAAVIGRMDLALLSDRSPEYYRQTLDECLGQAWQISHLVDGLLHLAKADYLPDSIKMEPVRIDELLIDTRESVRRAHPEYHIELLFGNDQAEDDRYITVTGNVYLLRIAMANLIENNCKYSDNHTAMVQLSWWGEWCYVTCSDNGMGMTPEEQESLFRLFYRGEQARQAQGHGIGMTLVQKIVDMHRGTVTVRSHTGEGTTFIVQLPHLLQ